ncbi:MAG: alpha/beta hydrolase [Verrucomicrobiales bacterium]|jgi:pimeloyl-ACP methyl ester carboxylesterase|nr:alpha/beta hydrolase [Verrucomicrobiales bacterium]
MKNKLPLMLAACCLSLSARAQSTFDWKIEKPEKYGAAPNAYAAEFRLRLPAADGDLDYVLVLLPGFNGDGRGMAGDGQWQRFADKQRAAIVACKLTVSGNAPHYVRVENWAGWALLDTLKHFAEETQKPALNTAPLLLWGHSAGGGFAYNFANWKPERVAGFALVKSALNTDDPRGATPKVPGLFIGGENDRERTELITKRYNSGRRRGALWCFAFEPNSGHEVGQSATLGRAFLRGVMNYRSASAAGGDTAWLGDLADHDVFPKGGNPKNNKATTWLPDEAFAEKWKTFTTGGKIYE